MTETMLQPETETETPETLSPYQTAQQLHAAEVALDERLLELEAHLEAAQVQSGDLMLTAALGGTRGNGEGARLVARVSAEIHEVYAAIGAARRQRREAIQQSYISEAEAGLAEAAKLRKLVTERQRESDRLRLAYEAFEGIEVTVKQDPLRGSNKPPATAKTERLRNQLNDLLARAESIKKRQVPDSGELVLDRLAKLPELFENFMNPVHVAPPRHELRSWFAEVKAAPDAKPPRGHMVYSGQNSNVIKLVWRGGEIIPDESGKAWDEYAQQQLGKFVAA